MATYHWLATQTQDQLLELRSHIDHLLQQFQIAASTTDSADSLLAQGRLAARSVCFFLLTLQNSSRFFRL